MFVHFALALATIFFICGTLDPVHAREAGLKATPADRAAIAACLKLAQARAVAHVQRSGDDNEKPGPEGRLAAAAREAEFDTASCIGAVANPCQQQPDGASTAGIVECSNREWAVWDERLNAAYKLTLKHAQPKHATAIRATQRAWLQWRAERCKLPAIENEGGTIVGPLTAGCMFEMTARQALWLESSLDLDAPK